MRPVPSAAVPCLLSLFLLSQRLRPLHNEIGTSKDGRAQPWMMIFLVRPLIQLAAAVSVDDFWEGSQVMNHSLDYYCKAKKKSEGGGAYFSSFAIIIVVLTSKLDSKM